ncbi:MAG TPA: ATP-binding protein, partial [Flavobacteriales bacterium]|nr:ATP-binding protein [Flavobacteriales bacterium]
GHLVKRFTINEGLCSDRCRKVVVSKGSVWVATDAGACVIDDPLGEARIEHWTSDDGIPSNDVQDIAGDDHSLYLATSAGLCIVPLTRTSHRQRAPRLVLGSVMLDRSPLRPGDRPVFVQGRSSLSVTAQALVFAGRDRLRYAFRTSPGGVWIDAAGGTFTIADLPAGDQVLEIRARTPASDWCAPVRLNIHVVAPWYRTWWMRTLLVLSAAAAGLVLMRVLAQRRIREHLNALAREQAVANERQRIAADVHDDLGAEISSLMMTARIAGSDPHAPQESRALASAMEAQTSGMMGKIDEIIWSLDPGSDTVLSTVGFIQRYAEDFAATHGLHFVAHVDGPNGDPPISTMVRRDLYLVTREALRNVSQHARARALRLTATCSVREIHLVIEDDGQGLPGDGRTGDGHGLENMRQRIHRMDGAITLERSELGGTRVGIRVPLP